uniref:Ubiquitin-conjugating enzyme E2 J1-like n=2 Tax=Hirondellea gigas TaxID=1518452 RepID=A0A2P2IBK7_9CRUS
MERSYNTRCPAVKRILREAKELHAATEEYYAVPLEDNLFEWHFTVRGPVDSEFEEGIYHGRIILPNEYPMKPPNIIFTTMNGRFETNKKICLSISGHHPETWRPSWSIRTALLAIIGYMPSRGLGNLASLDYSPEERKILARKSVQHVCPQCGPVAELLLPRNASNAAKLNREAKEISEQMTVTEKPLQGSESSDSGEETTKQNTASVVPSQSEASKTAAVEPSQPEPSSNTSEGSSNIRKRITSTVTTTSTTPSEIPTVISSSNSSTVTETTIATAVIATPVTSSSTVTATPTMTAVHPQQRQQTPSYAGRRFVSSSLILMCVLLLAVLFYRRLFSMMEQHNTPALY